MLHFRTVEKPTLDLLKKLMNDNILKDFILVGGTASRQSLPPDAKFIITGQIIYINCLIFLQAVFYNC
jgi:hypothetical protein